MKKISVRRFLQDPSCCSIAASATIANFYNNSIDYEFSKKVVIKNKIVKSLDDGLEGGEIGLLLNTLGFNKVTIIYSDLEVVDYSWANLSKNKLIKELEIAYKRGSLNKTATRSFVKWLKLKECNNNLIIDYKFGKYIRKFLKQGKPLICNFNWTLFFKLAKRRETKSTYIDDAVLGDCDYHSVVVYSFNKRGVYICDSHHEYYKYRLKRYRKGFYFISWEDLMLVMSNGEIIIPDEFIEGVADEIDKE